jgi:outer membrane immunogenic protein
MKRICFALILAVAATPAFSADMPVKAPRAAPAPIPVYSWTGCYIGGHVGGLFGRTKWDNPEGNDLGGGSDFIRVQTDDYSRFTGGAQLGCNYQVNSWVFGIEGDVAWANVDTRVVDDITNGDEFFRTKFDWYGTVRGRVGYAFDRWMAYGTGGVAFTHIRAGYENFDSSLTVLQSTDESTIKTGWVAGGGVEYALTNNWLLRGEALYYDFGNKVVAPSIGGGETAHVSFVVARLGFNYKFGP